MAELWETVPGVPLKFTIKPPELLLVVVFAGPLAMTNVPPPIGPLLLPVAPRELVVQQLLELFQLAVPPKAALPLVQRLVLPQKTLV